MERRIAFCTSTTRLNNEGNKWRFVMAVWAVSCCVCILVWRLAFARKSGDETVPNENVDNLWWMMPGNVIFYGPNLTGRDGLPVTLLENIHTGSGMDTARTCNYCTVLRTCWRRELSILEKDE